MSNESDADRDRAVSPQEFVRLFLSHERRILAFIVALMPNLTDAEDVLQETSLVMWDKFDQFIPGTNFAAWAFRIARFKTLEFHKKKGRQQRLFREEVMELLHRDAVSISDESLLRHRALEKCLRELPASLCDLIKTRYRPGGTLKQSADQIGRSAVSARKRLRRAHELLRACIQRSITEEEAKE